MYRARGRKWSSPQGSHLDLLCGPSFTECMGETSLPTHVCQGSARLLRGGGRGEGETGTFHSDPLRPGQEGRAMVVPVLTGPPGPTQSVERPPTSPPSS